MSKYLVTGAKKAAFTMRKMSKGEAYEHETTSKKRINHFLPKNHRVRIAAAPNENQVA